LLNAVGLPELITNTEADYEAKAVELASNLAELSAIKNKLEKNRLTTPLFDAKLFAKHIESAYEMMYDRYLSGLAPVSFEVKVSG
jgi:predicted O-linked N-acetylglucosamine transferase (SPINDLY family)